MISGLKPYPAYKDTRVEWLGAVPEHWEVRSNRTVFNEVNERNFPDEQMLSVTISEGVIRQLLLLQDSSQKDSSRLDRSYYKLVRPGDIVYNKMRAWQGAAGVSIHRGIVSPAYVVQRPLHGGDSVYLHHVIRTPAFATEAERWSYGIASDMWSLRPEHFKLIQCCLPPLPEQVAIVRFLDKANQCIQSYIRTKQKLIIFLEEQKQAVIHQAITGQIDVRTRKAYKIYKPSGVEWLRDVPVHWMVRKLGQIGRFSKGVGGNKADEVPEGIPCIRYGDLYTSHTNFIERSRSFVSKLKSTEYTPIKFGDILFAASGETIDEIGKSAVNLLTSEAVCGGDVILLRPKIPLDARYMGYVTNCRPATIQKSTMGRGITIMHVYAIHLKYVTIPLPPLSEQTAIVEYLDKVINDIDTAISSTRRQVEFLNEYRIRLIADVVTGKLDVRDAALLLSDETETIDAVANSAKS